MGAPPPEQFDPSWLARELRKGIENTSLDFSALSPPVTPAGAGGPLPDLAAALGDLSAPDRDLAFLVEHPFIGLCCGHRGSGKTATCVRIQELMRWVAAPYAVGLPEKARELLPDWYNIADTFEEIPPNAVIYVPESYRLFPARASGVAQGHIVSDLVNLSRHRQHTLLIDVQNPAQVNRYLVSEADVFLIKEPSPLGQGFERPQLREYMDAARGAFSLMKKARRKRSVYVVAPGVGITGQIMETRLPTIWSKLLSTIFSSTRVGERLPSAAAALPELGDRRRVRRRRSNKSVAERREKARAMKKAGYSLGEIAVALGVSKSQAFRYCQDDDARSL